MKHVLAGDVGGTRARFAIFAIDRTPRRIHHEVLGSRGFRSFEAALGEFLGRTASTMRGRLKISAATFGIAGPVVDQRVKTTNLPWTIDARSIGRAFSIPTVTLLNDLVAVGLGAIAAPPRKLFVVQGGRPKRTGATLSVIAAGTGLGEAVFLWDGQEHIACATEGAHVDFGPRSDVEGELLAMLRRQHGHVSYERVASGSTIKMLYHFFVQRKKVRESKTNAAVISAAEDPNVAIVELAESGRSEAAMRAIDLWSSVYGAEAGNLALKSLSTGGVLVSGGVSARLAKILKEGLPHASRRSRSAHSPFVEAFLDKGRMRAILERVPVAVCLEKHAGLLGAATHAAGRG